MMIAKNEQATPALVKCWCCGAQDTPDNGVGEHPFFVADGEPLKECGKCRDLLNRAPRQHRLGKRQTEAEKSHKRWEKQHAGELLVRIDHPDGTVEHKYV